MATKLDIKKAYDRLEWSFTRNCLLDLSFTDKWTGLIIKCITTPTFSMLVNGNLGMFLLRKGYSAR